MPTPPQARQLGRSATTADQLVELVDEMNRAADCIQRLESECLSRQQQLARRKKAHLATIHQARQWKRHGQIVARRAQGLEQALRSSIKDEQDALVSRLKAQLIAVFFAAMALVGWLR